MHSAEIEHRRQKFFVASLFFLSPKSQRAPTRESAPAALSIGGAERVLSACGRTVGANAIGQRICVCAESINRTLPTRAAPIECTRSALADKHKHCARESAVAKIREQGSESNHPLTRRSFFRAFYFATAKRRSLSRGSRRLFSNAPLDSVCRRVLHTPLRQPWRPSRLRSPLWSRVWPRRCSSSRPPPSTTPAASSGRRLLRPTSANVSTATHTLFFSRFATLWS